jgi:hypothetical protein
MRELEAPIIHSGGTAFCNRFAADLNFEFVSDLVLRISDFVPRPRRLCCVKQWSSSCKLMPRNQLTQKIVFENCGFIGITSRLVPLAELLFPDCKRIAQIQMP